MNRGIGGQTTAQMLLRFRADVVELQPKVVVILAGTNDIAGNAGPVSVEQVQDNLASMAELARAHGIKVVLASLLPVSDDKKDANGVALTRTRQRPTATIQALNRWLAEYAAKNAHTYLDYFSATADANGLLRPELNDDGLHPNAARLRRHGPAGGEGDRAGDEGEMTALLCLLAAAAAAAAPQAEPRPGQRPGATATLPAVRTELVQIDVVVTGKDGRCVDGIAQGEFEVLEDGKPQTLSHFAVEARPGLRAEAVAPPHARRRSRPRASPGRLRPRADASSCWPSTTCTPRRATWPRPAGR